MIFFTNERENALLRRFTGVFIRDLAARPSTTHAGRNVGGHADRAKNQQAAFLGRFAPEARGNLNGLLERCVADGELQFTVPDVLKLPHISQHGNVAEIIGKFGGANQLRSAVNQPQTLLYAA